MPSTPTLNESATQQPTTVTRTWDHARIDCGVGRLFAIYSGIFLNGVSYALMLAQDFKYKQIDILDWDDEDIKRHFKSGIEFIDEGLHSGGVLVHWYAIYPCFNNNISMKWRGSVAIGDNVHSLLDVQRATVIFGSAWDSRGCQTHDRAQRWFRGTAAVLPTRIRNT